MKALSFLFLAWCVILSPSSALASGQAKFLQVNVNGHNVRTSPEFLAGSRENVAFQTKAGSIYPISKSIQTSSGQAVEILVNGRNYWVFVPEGRSDFRFCENNNCLKETLGEGLKQIFSPGALRAEPCRLSNKVAAPLDRGLNETDSGPQYVKKPEGGESLKEAEVMCKGMAAEANRRGTKALYIAFEGLKCMDKRGRAKANKYHVDIMRGAWNASPPKGSGRWPGGGFLLHGQIVPLIKKHPEKIEFLDLPWDSIQPGSPSVAEVCASIWREEVPGAKIVVMGHSLGGHSAAVLAEHLHKKRVPVDLVVTVDPVLQWKHRPEMNGSVREWKNYYQKDKNGLFQKPSTTIEGTENIYRPKYNHLNMTTSQEIQGVLEAAVRD